MKSKSLQVCILAGSPRKKGNTASLLKPFTEELLKRGAAVEHIRLHELHIEACVACRACQDVADRFGCVHDDDLQGVFESVAKSDCIVLATPIYSWYCTGPMKLTLDRFVYGFNKYYSSIKGLSLWKNKPLVIFTTCGYRIENGTGLFEGGMKHYCKHSQLVYMGMFAARDRGYNTPFVTDEKVAGAREFAIRLHERLATEDAAPEEPISVRVE